MCLPSCVPHASTFLSKHRVGVEPLFCLFFWDRGRDCSRGGRGTVLQATDEPISFLGFALPASSAHVQQPSVPSGHHWGPRGVLWKCPCAQGIGRPEGQPWGPCSARFQFAHGPEWIGIYFVLHALHRGRECKQAPGGPPLGPLRGAV